MTPPWQQFFLSLASGADVAAVATATPPAGDLPLNTLQVIDSPRLLGRGTAGTGRSNRSPLARAWRSPDLDLAVTGDVSTVGVWTPITDGVTPIAELLFDADGDCVVGFVPTPV